MVNNVYIIKTPLQLLNAIEAKDKFSTREDDLLIVDYSGEERNDAQINKLLNKFKIWNKIYKFPVILSTKEKVIYYSIVTFLFLLKRVEIKNIFVGEYRSDCMWMMINTLKHQQAYILDDGTATLAIPSIFNNLNNYNKNTNKLKNKIFRFFGFQNSNISKINLFTMYNLKDIDNIYKNNYSFLKSILKDIQTKNQNIVYFIGSNMIKDEYMSKEYFYTIFTKIIEYYKSKNKKLIYIPHRREDTQVIRLLFPELEIVRFENMIELEFLFNSTVPNHIASFYSTALYTLNVIYDIQYTDSFLFNLNEIDEKHRLVAKESYDLYKNNYNIISLVE